MSILYSESFFIFSRESTIDESFTDDVGKLVGFFIFWLQEVKLVLGLLEILFIFML